MRAADILVLFRLVTSVDFKPFWGLNQSDVTILRDIRYRFDVSLLFYVLTHLGEFFLADSSRMVLGSESLAVLTGCAASSSLAPLFNLIHSAVPGTLKSFPRTVPPDLDCSDPTSRVARLQSFVGQLLLDPVFARLSTARNGTFSIVSPDLLFQVVDEPTRKFLYGTGAILNCKIIICSFIS